MSTATEVGMRRRAAEPHMDALMACLRLMSDIPVTLFIAPSATCDLARAAKTAPKRELRVGDRVWCFPGTDRGHEGTVVGFWDGVKKQSYDMGADAVRVDSPHNNGIGAYDLAEVVLFDENHNQKREFAKGKKIQGRLKSLGEYGIWYDVDSPIWHEATEYRVKPAVASEKWGPERAAYARGDRIEARALPGRYNPGAVHRWHYVDVPVWSADCEYRVQPPMAQRDYSVGAPTAMTIGCDFAAVDKFATEKAAYAAGKVIQYHAPGAGVSNWRDCLATTCVGVPQWYWNLEYRIKPDPYAEIKAAVAAGKTVQFRNGGVPTGEWLTSSRPYNFCFCFPPSEYRVKPEPVVTEQVVRVEVNRTPFSRQFHDVTLRVETLDGLVLNVRVKEFS